MSNFPEAIKSTTSGYNSGLHPHVPISLASKAIKLLKRTSSLSMVKPTILSVDVNVNRLKANSCPGVVPEISKIFQPNFEAPSSMAISLTFPLISRCVNPLEFKVASTPCFFALANFSSLISMANTLAPIILAIKAP